jgi:hypothetical protein
VELLHSEAYLQAIVQFAAHVQLLVESELQLLSRSRTPIRVHGSQLTMLAHVSAADIHTTICNEPCD